MKFTFKTFVLLSTCLVFIPASAQKGETVRIAFIDPLSGPFAGSGINLLKSWQYVAERASGAGDPAGVKFEVAGFDNKGSPQDSLSALQSAIDQGFRYVTQGQGSGAALALADAVTKHNERNPGKELIYLTYAAKDPSLTNERCSYWHFRLDADTSMRMEAVTSFMRDRPAVRKIYLINQKYTHGEQTARFFKEAIARKRPDVQIVGEDFVPLGQTKDFAPYAAKIRQSGADTIVTSNWGNDLTLLVKALSEAGVMTAMYTNDAMVSGTPTALAGIENSEVYAVTTGYPNIGGEIGDVVNGFKKKFNDDYYYFTTYDGLKLLGQAMANARSTNPVLVASALEGLTVKSYAGAITMRKSDHQLQQTMFITHWQKTDKANPYSVENTGFTFAPVKRIEAYQASTPTSCQMKRPA